METIYTNKTVLRIIDDLLIWYDKLKEKYTFVQVWNYLPSYIYNMAYQERWCPLNKEGYANRTDILNFKDGYKIKDYIKEEMTNHWI